MPVASAVVLQPVKTCPVLVKVLSATEYAGDPVTKFPAVGTEPPVLVFPSYVIAYPRAAHYATKTVFAAVIVYVAFGA